MPGPPPFDASQCDFDPRWSVPRERRQDFASATGYSSRPIRLTPGPCASLSPDIDEDPTVAHIPNSHTTEHVIMYSKDRTMTLEERADNFEPKVPCPHSELKRDPSTDWQVHVHLPRTNLSDNQ